MKSPPTRVEADDHARPGVLDAGNVGDQAAVVHADGQLDAARRVSALAGE